MKRQNKAIDHLALQYLDHKTSYQPKSKYVCPDACFIKQKFGSCPTPVDKTLLDETKYTENQKKRF